MTQSPMIKQSGGQKKKIGGQKNKKVDKKIAVLYFFANILTHKFF
jgi:hypothetical protein